MNTLPNDSTAFLHKYYMEIINCMPGALYWLDVDCNLQGYNANFVKLLSIENDPTSNISPYELMINNAKWPKDSVERFRQSDMAVIFSGESQVNVREDVVKAAPDTDIYLLANRHPLFGPDGRNVVGLAVSLLDIANSPKKEVQAGESPVQESTKEIPKILIVEDNKIAQSAEKQLFAKLNCNVEVVATADGALKAFEAGKYDLIIMDIALKDVTGYTVAKKIRSQENSVQTPIIALTSYNADNVKYDCEYYAMNGVITNSPYALANFNQSYF